MLYVVIYDNDDKDIAFILEVNFSAFFLIQCSMRKRTHTLHLLPEQIVS